MNKIPVPVGASAELVRTITQQDVEAFARLSGDFHPFHIDPEYARRHGAPDCFAHGILTMSLLSTLGTTVYSKYKVPVVAYGYDRVRFVKPVYVGDTVTASYRVAQVLEDEMKAYAECICSNQHGHVVLAATHISKFV
jgi:3-hydroxybutyryl-CoA dehydratase